MPAEHDYRWTLLRNLMAQTATILPSLIQDMTSEEARRAIQMIFATEEKRPLDKLLKTALTALFSGRDIVIVKPPTTGQE